MKKKKMKKHGSLKCRFGFIDDYSIYGVCSNYALSIRCIYTTSVGRSLSETQRDIYGVRWREKE